MPQSSYAYAVARVRVLEGKLLNRDKLERMLDANSAEDALKVLAETDYGQAVAELKTPYDYEQLLSREIQKTYDFIAAVSPNPRLTDCFVLKYDFHNLKVLLKNRYLDADDDSLLVGAGKIPLEQMKAAVYEKNYRDLPQPMKEAIERIDNLFSMKVNPQQIDIILDRVLYDWIFSILEKEKNTFLIKYFGYQVDLLNILSFLRVRRIGKGKDFLEEVLIPHGFISLSYFIDNMENPVENFMDKFAYSDYGTVVAEGIQSFIKTGNVNQFEKLADDFMLAFVKKHRGEAFGIEPIIGYLLAKENEVKAIRIIMVGLINHIATEIIRERLRELYV